MSDISAEIPKDPPKDSSPSKILRSESDVQEKRVPHDAQSLIDAYRQYATFKKTFQQFEDSERVDTEQLQPPWKKIGEAINRDRAESKRVISLAGESQTPKDLGRVLFEAKDKFDQTASTGIVKAFHQGSCIVIVVSNNADLLKVTNIDRGDKQTTVTEGTFERSTFRFKKGSDTIVLSQIPTIVVLDKGEAHTQASIRHEKNHYQFDMYLDEACSSRLINRFNALLHVRETLDLFNKGKVTEDIFLDQLRTYSQQMRYKALIESACEMIATGRMDWRDAYADDYFEKVIPPGMPAGVNRLVEQVKGEFRKDMRAIKDRSAGILYSFSRIEGDSDLVYGTVNMRLLMADAKTIDQALDDMEFIRMIDSGREATDLRQEIYSLKAKPIYGDTAPQLYEKVEQLLRLNFEETNKAGALQSYGYKKARQEGKDFPEALEIAVLSRAAYQEKTNRIRSKTKAVEGEINDLDRMREAQWAIKKAEHVKDLAETPTNSRSLSPSPSTEKAGLLRRVLRRLRK